MNKIYVSKKAHEPLKKYLKNLGYQVVEVSDIPGVAATINHHPDIKMCQLKDHIFHGDESLLGEKYPQDVIYNGCSTGKYFIHNLKYTHPDLLASAKRAVPTLIDVPQGYCRCTILPVDEDSIITSDQGSASICKKAGMHVLLINQGQILLTGYSYGFIGGCAGRIGDEIVFHGNLAAHPDGEKIIEFIKSRGLSVKFFPEFPLTDIGSILVERTF